MRIFKLFKKKSESVWPDWITKPNGEVLVRTPDNKYIPINP